MEMLVVSFFLSPRNSGPDMNLGVIRIYGPELKSWRCKIGPVELLAPVQVMDWLPRGREHYPSLVSTSCHSLKTKIVDPNCVHCCHHQLLDGPPLMTSQLFIIFTFPSLSQRSKVCKY